MHFSGHENIVRILIEHGASNINAKGESGFSPLHTAAAYGRANVTEFLISRGANVNAMNDDQMTPLDLAETNGELPK